MTENSATGDSTEDGYPHGGDPSSAHPTPGQPGAQAPPVPAPGMAPGTTTPGVQTAQGASPQDGIHADDKAAGSDASTTSPGAWTALAPPGKPDGEVDTRSN